MESEEITRLIVSVSHVGIEDYWSPMNRPVRLTNKPIPNRLSYMPSDRGETLYHGWLLNTPPIFWRASVTGLYFTRSIA